MFFYIHPALAVGGLTTTTYYFGSFHFSMQFHHGFVSVAWYSVVPCLHLCALLSLIDQFGDHLLGFLHGPLRIQRHNSLVSIVH